MYSWITLLPYFSSMTGHPDTWRLNFPSKTMKFLQCRSANNTLAYYSDPVEDRPDKNSVSFVTNQGIFSQSWLLLHFVSRQSGKMEFCLTSEYFLLFFCLIKRKVSQRIRQLTERLTKNFLFSTVQLCRAIQAAPTRQPSLASVSLS